MGIQGKSGTERLGKFVNRVLRFSPRSGVPGEETKAAYALVFANSDGQNKGGFSPWSLKSGSSLFFRATRVVPRRTEKRQGRKKPRPSTTAWKKEKFPAGGGVICPA